MSASSESVIQERLRRAMLSRSADEVMVLRGLLAAIKNLKIEKRAEVGDADFAQIVRRELKQRDEAIGFAEQAARGDLVEKNRKEKLILESFLPQELPAEDLARAIERHHQEGAAAIGPLMAKLKAEFGARLDGKTASAAVRKFLDGRGGA